MELKQIQRPIKTQPFNCFTCGGQQNWCQFTVAWTRIKFRGDHCIPTTCTSQVS